MKNKFQTLLALVVVLGLLIAAMPADRAQAQTPQTLQVAQWSTPVTLANVSGRPAVVYDGTNYHLWYTVTESGSLVYTSSATPDSFAAGTATTGLGASQSSPAVMKEGDTFYMINYGATGETEFDLYTSTNGIDWTNAGVVYAGDGLTDYAKFDAPSLLKDTNGYKLYFQVKSSATGNPYSIYVATSTAASLAELVGTPFTGATLALAPGASGAWDADRVQHPMVVKDGDKYYMWYVGYPVGLTQKLGVATSSDGTAWTKGANNPIISTRTAEPSVVKVGDIWHLWYLSTSPSITYISANMPFVVPQSSVYATIQAAINAAAAGDTINVTAGTYVEDVNVNKAITLVGAGADVTKIVGTTGMKTPLTFATSGALVRGFTLTHEYTEAELAAWDNTTINNNGVTFNQNTAGNTLENCTVTLNRNGIYLNNTQNSNVITGNTITNNRTGINTTNNINGTQITNNMISGNWTLGFVYYSQGIATDFSTVILTGNTFDSNWYSEILIKDAGTSAGTFDVSGNTFTDVPVTFSTSADPSLNEPSFTSQKPVALGGTATKPEQDLPTIRIYNSPSVSFQTGPKTLLVGAAPLFTTIQSAIDAASDGDTINVAAGTYAEQLTISKSITLQGANGDSIIQAFDNMPSCFTTSAANRPIVCVKDTDNAIIDGFTIDGLGKGNTNNRFIGVAFYNAGGTLKNSTVRDVRDTPFSGAQHGVGIYAYNVDTTARTIHVLDNTVTGFQKTGIAVNASDTNPLTADIQRNTVNGVGATTVTAQNGIQVWAAAGNGVVADNTITGIAYDNTNSTTQWLATSILNYYTDLDVTGNTITGAHMGIYYYGGYGLIQNNDLTIEKVGVYAYGIEAADPPDAIPSPYDAMIDTGKADLSIAAIPTPIEISGNQLVFSGADETATYGIEADAGYDASDLAVDIHHNAVSGFENGLVFYQCDADCGTGTFTGISAVSNDLTDNTVGIYLGGAIPAEVAPVIHHNRIVGDVSTDTGLENDLTTSVTAENNWWGCNAGPADAACVGTTGLVDADPWLTLTLTADQSQMTAGGVINLLASLKTNSNNEDTSASGIVMDGIPVGFATTYGTLNAVSGSLINGTAAFTLTVPEPMTKTSATVSATVDNQTADLTLSGWLHIFLPFIMK